MGATNGCLAGSAKSLNLNLAGQASVLGQASVSETHANQCEKEPDTLQTEDSSAKETDELLPKPQQKATPQAKPFSNLRSGLPAFVSDLHHHFGYKHLMLLFVSQFLNKSFAHTLFDGATPWIFKSYHVAAGEMQLYGGIASLPWSMKPIFGIASDLFPINGLNKTPYLLMTTTCGIFALIAVGLSTPQTLPLVLVVVCFFFIQLYVAFADLLTEAKFSQKIRDNPVRGPALMSYVWGGMLLAGLVAVLMNGTIIHLYGPTTLCLIASIPAAALLIPILGNYMEEVPQSSRQAARHRSKFFEQEREVVFLCLLMFAGSLSLIITPIVCNAENIVLYSAIASLVVAAILVGAFAIFLAPPIAKFNAFSMIQTSLSFSHSAAAFYFYTNTAEEYPEGPHFSPFFFSSVIGAWTAFFAMVGVYTYQKYFSNWPYRSLMIAAQLGLAICSVLDLMMFSRLNLKLGIPDKAMIIGMSGSSMTLRQLQWMPQVVMFAQLCPKGMEATMYALLASAHNLGGVVASNCGALLLQRLGVTPRGVPHEGHVFDNLWISSALGSLMPLITILLLFKLLPDVKQTDKILANSSTATGGSLWQRWFQGPGDPSSNRIQSP